MPYNPGREAVAAPRSGVVTAGSNPVTRTNVGVHSARLENGNRKCGCHFLICAPWLLLSESNPLRWASIRFSAAAKSVMNTRTIKGL